MSLHTPHPYIGRQPSGHPRLLGRALLAGAAIAGALLASPAAHAELVRGLVKFRQYTGSAVPATAQTPAVPGGPRLALTVYANNTDPVNDPSNTFVHAYAKPNTLSSLFRFERTLTRVSSNIPFDARLYVVPKGAVITTQRLLAGTYPMINSTGFGFRDTGPLGLRPQISVGRDVWLVIALHRPKPYPNNASPTDPFDHFSWVHLRFNALGVPQMIDHITAYEEPGLIVGSTEPCQVCQP